jgi:hypothetical protein
MKLALEMAGAVVATCLLFFCAGPLLARGLRLKGIQAQFAAIGVRLFTTVLLALSLAFSGLEDRVALIFTVGATYFAAAMFDGARHFRKREMKREMEG